MCLMFVHKGGLHTCDGEVSVHITAILKFVRSAEEMHQLKCDESDDKAVAWW